MTVFLPYAMLHNLAFRQNGIVPIPPQEVSQYQLDFARYLFPFGAPAL
jgi:hypothetical protein